MSNFEGFISRIADRIRQCGGGKWLDEVENALTSSVDLPADANILISGARRALGSQVIVNPDEVWGVEHAVSRHWTMAELGRVYVLARLLHLNRMEEARLEEAVWKVYRYSADTEKEAIIKSLVLLPDNERFKPMALDATRTNSKEILSALLNGNTYPSRRFSDSEFNGLVLKALFMRIAIVDMPGLEGRSNPELSRMCEDYIQELKDAGRDVPTDIWLALAGSMSRRGADFLREYGSGPDSRHRFYAAMAIEKNLSRSTEWREYVKDRLAQETDDSVLVILNRIGT